MGNQKSKQNFKDSSSQNGRAAAEVKSVKKIFCRTCASVNVRAYKWNICKEPTAFRCIACGSVFSSEGMRPRRGDEALIKDDILFQIKKQLNTDGSSNMSGVELAELREACGWTQRDFAALIGRSRGSVVHWERGGSPVPVQIEDGIRIAASIKLEAMQALEDANNAAASKLPQFSDGHWVDGSS